MAFTFEQIVADIRNRVYHPIYFFKKGRKKYKLLLIFDSVRAEIPKNLFFIEYVATKFIVKYLFMKS